MVPDADASVISTSGIILQHLEINIQELSANIDFNFVVKIAVAVMSDSNRDTLTLANALRLRFRKDDCVTSLGMLIHAIEAFTPSPYSSRMLYLKKLDILGIILKMKLDVELAEVRFILWSSCTHIVVTILVLLLLQSDNYTCSRTAHIAHSTMTSLSRITRGLTNINPSFVLKGMSISNVFDRPESLTMRIAKVYVAQLGFQLLTVSAS